MTDPPPQPVDEALDPGDGDVNPGDGDPGLDDSVRPGGVPVRPGGDVAAHTASPDLDDTTEPPLAASSQDLRMDVHSPTHDAYGITDIGHRRRTNQDQFLIARLNKSMRVDATSLPLEPRIYGSLRGHVMVVADGMGGHAGGARASELAIGYLVSRVLGKIHWHFHGEAEEAAFIRSLQRMLQDTHARILAESSHDASNRGMGTTCTMAYVVWPTMYVVHAGDSRCYVIKGEDRDGHNPDATAYQMTTDHTMARRMVESGGLDPADEATSRWSNVLWNVLGGHSDTELIADVQRVDLPPGDTVVLCSDGLYRYIDAKQLASVVIQSESPKEAARELVRIALSAGGEDNVTAVVYQSPPHRIETSTWIDDFDSQLRGEG